MKQLIRFEEFTLFLFSIYLFQDTDFEWWWYPALFLVPDISMLGYIANTTVGAVSYNIFHHKAIAILFICAGWYLDLEWAQLIGIIFLGHSSIDRVFGYGLKFYDHFQHTHLGWLNENK